MDNLFICFSPLQALTAIRIIETQQLKKAECALLFFADHDNEKMRLYFGRLASLCSESHFEVLHRRSLLGDLAHVRKLLTGRRFHSVFLANTNQPCTQIALSTITFDCLYTFDDGTGSLSQIGLFTRPFGMGIRRFLSTLLLGNRYYQARIRKLAQRHFTIYRGMPNNTLAPLEEIDLIAAGGEAPDAPECTLVLGTVLKEMTKRTDSPVAEALSRFAATLTGEVWYLPHPRGEAVPALDAHTLHSDKVAEEVIIDLLSRHSRVNLYGFGSATQFLFIAEPRIRNHLLRPAAMRPELRAIVDEAARHYGIARIDL